MNSSTPEIPSHEWLARFVLRREHVRSDGTVKPDPFIPYKHVELSVTRHWGLSEDKIWAVGESVADQTKALLRGRADAQVEIFTRQRLRAIAAPEVNNPNHANIVDWPGDKQAQKEIALELVKDVCYVSKPT